MTIRENGKNMDKSIDAAETRLKSGIGVNLTGMLVFLASEAFLFGALFFTYFYLKINTPVWPPAGVQPDRGLAIINTTILLSSSGVVWLASRFIRKGNISGLAAVLLATAIMGSAFLGITVWEWTHEAFRSWSSAYGAIFYTMTGFHALHVMGGVLLMLALSIRARRGRYSRGNFTAIEVGSLYWHYVDFIWVLVFTTLFLIR
jgi:heme/copper-type cytochrome/quinol oxidase subunit 3